MGLYVYAVAHAEAHAPLELRGLLGEPVYGVPSGVLAALVSECPLSAVRPERKHIAAAQSVLRALNERSDVLPMAFGTLSDSRRSLEAFLDDRHDSLLAALGSIAGAVEMGLRLSLDVPDPIAYLVARTPELLAARARVFGRHRAASHDAKIRLGQLCEGALRRFREAEAAQVMAALAPCCARVVEVPLREEREVVNLAMLVPRTDLARFDAAVSEAAAQFDDDRAFSVSGPWPPHNFVQLDSSSL